MELNTLRPAKNAKFNAKRVGRGMSAGQGKTCGRGHKGQGARKSPGPRPGFEGGQMPLIRRIPKRGFKNFNRVEFQVVNVRDLESLEGDVSPEALKAAGLIASLRKPVKVLGQGEFTKTLAVSAHAFSASARQKIQAAGGSVSVIGEESTDDR